MEKKDGRGAKPKFSPPEREFLAELILQHGIRGAQRNAKMSVCQKTLGNIAREFGIQFAKGRRPRSAA